MQLVLDTNIVLDLLVFADPQAQPLTQGLAEGRLRWLATGAMRDELERVLAYPKIAPRVGRAGRTADTVLEAFDRQVRLVEPAPRAAVCCGDPDDQKFVDLAVAHRCTLVSKDREVLRMRKRLALLSVQAVPRFA